MLPGVVIMTRDGPVSADRIRTHVALPGKRSQVWQLLLLDDGDDDDDIVWSHLGGHNVMNWLPNYSDDVKRRMHPGVAIMRRW